MKKQHEGLLNQELVCYRYQSFNSKGHKPVLSTSFILWPTFIQARVSGQLNWSLHL